MGIVKKLKSVAHATIKLLPKNNFGDRIVSLIYFYSAYGRFPNNEPLLSNYLYRLKHDGEAMNPLRVYVSDKEFVKDYVTVKIGDNFNVPTIQVLHSIEEALDFEFPDRCCIKPTHLTGAVILRENGETIDQHRIKEWFELNTYNETREQNYRYLRPKVIVEPLIFDTTDNEDIKVFCYKGKVKLVQVVIGRNEQHTRLFYDRFWNRQDFSMRKAVTDESYEKPVNLDVLLSLAEILSADFEFIRVDFYTDGDQILLGELTNCPESGGGYFVPSSGEVVASRMIFS